MCLLEARLRGGYGLLAVLHGCTSAVGWWPQGDCGQGHWEVGAGLLTVSLVDLLLHRMHIQHYAKYSVPSWIFSRWLTYEMAIVSLLLVL